MFRGYGIDFGSQNYNDIQNRFTNRFGHFKLIEFEFKINVTELIIRIKFNSLLFRQTTLINSNTNGL